VAGLSLDWQRPVCLDCHMHTRVMSTLVAVVVILASLAGAAAAFGFIEFQMPSHQILCGEAKGETPSSGPYLRCDTLFLNDRAMVLTTKGPAKLDHVTDAIANPHLARVLAYGTTRKFGPFICTSKTTGLYCHVGNHGFALSRQFQTVY
jgi:hypothetical protein